MSVEPVQIVGYVLWIKDIIISQLPVIAAVVNFVKKTVAIKLCRNFMSARSNYNEYSSVYRQKKKNHLLLARRHTKTIITHVLMIDIHELYNNYCFVSCSGVDDGSLC